MCPYEDFCVRYLRHGIHPINFKYLSSLMRIYLMTVEGYKFGNRFDIVPRIFSETLARMNYGKTGDNYFVDVRPRRTQSNIAKAAKKYLEQMGYIVLHEVPCRESPTLDYDFAFIYDGIFGSYLYYVEIDGQQHFNRNHFFNQGNTTTQDHDKI